MKTKRKSIIASLLLLILLVACQKETTTPNYGELKSNVSITPGGFELCQISSTQNYGRLLLVGTATSITGNITVNAPNKIKNVYAWFGVTADGYPKINGCPNFTSFPIKKLNINKTSYSFSTKVNNSQYYVWFIVRVDLINGTSVYELYPMQGVFQYLNCNSQENRYQVNL